MTDIPGLTAANLSGETTGLPCFCSANEQVLRAVLDVAAETGFPTVIEATCNQVNQNGGYTGMTADDFMSWIRQLARDAGVPSRQLVLGGDHLGPNPWRRESATTAMDKARELVRQYAAAGFRKIHLDASMPCGGEPPLAFEEVARRAAELCAVAEASAPDPGALIYVIGTEVPIPGGEIEEPGALDVTSVERLFHTIGTHRQAFMEKGLDDAWSRIASVVVQPGVDFSHTKVYAFDPLQAAPLRSAVEDEPGLTFEAHSTDYQSNAALHALVENHFFFLKVGPELTFRFREAVYALAEIESVMKIEPASRLTDVVSRCMAQDPAHWQDYYKGTPDEIELLKRFSYSDRIRYYWNDVAIASALGRLMGNLRNNRPPETVVLQFFGGSEFGRIDTDPETLMRQHIQRSVRRYFAACGYTE